MKKRNETEPQEQETIAILKIKDLRKRPYGLCSKAGISTSGMSPREAWSAWNAYRKDPCNREKQMRKEAKRLKIQKKTAPKSLPKKRSDRGSEIVIPELSADLIDRANMNSMFNRGKISRQDYIVYANEILSWDISDNKKRQLLDDLHKRWEKKLVYEAQHVPWTVAGPARYNPRKYDKSEQILRSAAENLAWFEAVKESVHESKRQYIDRTKERAERAEEWFDRQLKSGMLRKSSNSEELHPKMVADALVPIAQYDPKRFQELYEKYDSELHFRKGTNADKVYQSVKSGTFQKAAPPKKLHETDHLNTYQSKLKSGEDRVFLKFTTRPKPQMIMALKRRGWHWNALESAWSVPVGKYDEAFIKGIDERYAKYL